MKKLKSDSMIICGKLLVEVGAGLEYTCVSREILIEEEALLD